MGQKKGILHLLRPYRPLLFLLLLFTLLSNAVNLIIPKIIAKSIDAFNSGHFFFRPTLLQFGIAVLFIFVLTYLQSIMQTYTSERVARDLRTKLSTKLSQQSYSFIEQANPSKLLTHITADVDSIKMFVAQAIVSITSSIFIIIGVSVLLISINWRLALTVIAIIPIIGITFFLVLKKVRALFIQSRAVIDRLNKVISESIMGAALIRVVHAQQLEYDKFLKSNEQAKSFGLSILRLFAGLIPVITFTANIATLAILVLGGHFTMSGNMSLGDFAAFNSYLAMLIFPILVIGFMSNVIAQASASYDRIRNIIESPDEVETGSIKRELSGAITLRNVSLSYGQTPILKDISFSISPGSKTAIVGPTAAGKTQLLHLLTGLTQPQSGSIVFDGHPIEDYDKESFYQQVGFVFQDSIIFNMSIQENIAFSEHIKEQALSNAIAAAELDAFINAQPNKLDTIVSERGTSLSGGQKQRIMLARALAKEPRLLLLDDFTARVDNNTEKKILNNIQQRYPGITLVSITQKIATVTHYDQIILMMQGEIIAIGKHETLLQESPEYVQLFHSQHSTSNYEL